MNRFYYLPTVFQGFGKPPSDMYGNDLSSMLTEKKHPVIHNLASNFFPTQNF